MLFFIGLSKIILSNIRQFYVLSNLKLIQKTWVLCSDQSSKSSVLNNLPKMCLLVVHARTLYMYMFLLMRLPMLHGFCHKFLLICCAFWGCCGRLAMVDNSLIFSFSNSEDFFKY